MKYMINVTGLGGPAHIMNGKKSACGMRRNPRTHGVYTGPGDREICRRCQTKISEPTVRLKPSKKTGGLVLKSSDVFLKTMEWRKLRMQALIKYGPKCMCCGATPATGAVMNVDHIKPRKTHPELALDINNLQILCGTCNAGKSNWDTTDWRGENGSIP